MYTNTFNNLPKNPAQSIKHRLLTILATIKEL